MNFRKYFFIATAVFLVLFTVFLSAVFLRYRSWSSDPHRAEKLTAYFSSVTKSEFRYQSLGWRLLPFPAVHFSDPVFKFKSDLHHELKARSLVLSLDLVKLVSGSFGFSELHLREGVWEGQIEAPKGIHNFTVDHIDLKTSALRSDQPVKIYMSGDTGGRRKAVVIHGDVKLPELDEPRLDGLGFEVQVLTRNFQFKDSPEWEFLGGVPSSGVSDFLIELKHQPSGGRIDFSGDAGLHDLAFRSAVEKVPAAVYKLGNLQVKFAGYFSPKSDELKLTQCSAELPFSRVNLQGAYLPHHREFRSMTFSFTNVKWDELFTYFPDLKNHTPSYIGLSGLSDLSFSLNGFPNHLKIYGDFDLTHTLFTYGRFFQKAKEKPFHLKSDLDWAAELLSGEFSGNVEALTFKGNLPEWRPTGAMKINFITNSFAADQLPGFVPLLSSYELGGNMKMFANFDGNFKSAEPFQKMFHLNMQDGRILRKGTGSGFKDLDLDLDFGPLMMEAKAPRFSLGGSFFAATLKAVQPEKDPRWVGHLTSEKLVAANVWKEWKDFWGGENAAWLESLHPLVRKMILNEDLFESLKLDFSSENKNYKVESLEASLFGGQLTASGGVQGQKSEIQMKGKGMDAARLSRFLGASQPALEGRVDWAARLEGSHTSDRSDWSGPLSLSMKEGFLNHFGYVQAFEEMETLKKASTPGSDKMPFRFLRMNGRLENETLQVDQVNFENEQVQIEGEGQITGEGALDFRLKTHLEAGYFRELFPKRANYFISEQDSFFGPVTLLASGPLDGLSLKPDSKSIAELAGWYAKKKTESISKYL